MPPRWTRARPQQSSACLSNKTARTWPRNVKGADKRAARGYEGGEGGGGRSRGVKESISLVERKVADQKISRFERPWSFVDASSKTRSHHKRSQNRYEHGALLFFSSLLPSLFLRSFLLFSSSSFFFPPYLPFFPFFFLLFFSPPPSPPPSSRWNRGGRRTISRGKWSLEGDRRGSIESLEGRSDCIINWDTTPIQILCVCLFLHSKDPLFCLLGFFNWFVLELFPRASLIRGCYSILCTVIPDISRKKKKKYIYIELL